MQGYFLRFFLLYSFFPRTSQESHDRLTISCLIRADSEMSRCRPDSCWPLLVIVGLIVLSYPALGGSTAIFLANRLK